MARNWGHLTRFFDLVTLISNVRINLLLWGPFSWERINVCAPSRTNCLIQEGKKIISENWMAVGYSPSDPWVSVHGEGGIQVEKHVISMYLGAAPTLSHHLNYESLYHKHHMICILLPTSLKPITHFFKLNIWEFFRIKIKLASALTEWALSFFSHLNTSNLRIL